MPNFMALNRDPSRSAAATSKRAGTRPAPCPYLRRLTQLGEADGELPPPPAPLLGEAAGDVTTGVFGWPLLGPLPNQFHLVKPKNSSISTSRAMSTAAMPAPAPVVSPLVSTTSEPAGLQYLRTL